MPTDIELACTRHHIIALLRAQYHQYTPDMIEACCICKHSMECQSIMHFDDREIVATESNNTPGALQGRYTAIQQHNMHWLFKLTGMDDNALESLVTDKTI